MSISRKVYNFSQPKAKNLKTEVFTLIESHRTDELIQLITEYPDQFTNMIAQNHWSIAMYAVRYGDHKLMRFLQGMDLLHEHVQSSYSLIHAACFSNDVKTLSVLIDELGRDPNQVGQQYQDNCPLKYAYKNDLFKTVEFLCTRGAYYQYLDLCNNFKIVRDQQNQLIFVKLNDNYEQINKSQVLILSQNKHMTDDKITPYIRFMRFRNILYVLRYYQKCIENKQEDKIRNTKLGNFEFIFRDVDKLKEVISYAAPKYQ